MSFASSYAKKFLERHYDGLSNSSIGQRAAGLDSRSRRFLEFTLMGVGSLVATQRDKFVASPVKTVIWEVLYDAPSEIIARLSRLEASKHEPNKPFDTSDIDEQVALISSSLEDLNPKQYEDLLKTFSLISKEDLQEIVSSVGQKIALEITHQLNSPANDYQSDTTNAKTQTCVINDEEQNIGPIHKSVRDSLRASTKELDERNRRLDEKRREQAEKIQQARNKRRLK